MGGERCCVAAGIRVAARSRLACVAVSVVGVLRAGDRGGIPVAARYHISQAAHGGAADSDAGAVADIGVLYLLLDVSAAADQRDEKLRAAACRIFQFKIFAADAY